MTNETPENPPSKTDGALLALAAVEHLLRGDQKSLNETIQGATDVELGFAVAFLAGNLGAYIVRTSEDPAAVVAEYRRQVLGG